MIPLFKRHGVSQKRNRAGRDVIANQEVHHHHYGEAPLALETLPPRPDGFTGRQTELEKVLDLLDPTSQSSCGGVVVSAVAGMGGVGKTTLATEAGHAALERGWFSAVLFLDLHGYSPGLTPLTAERALETLLRDLGVPEVHIPPTVDERAGLYRSRLQEIAAQRGAPVLVIADNAAEAHQIEPLLPGRGTHRLLVTSRVHLDLLRTVGRVDLDVLTEHAAVDLLKRVLANGSAAKRLLADPSGIARVAKGCGFLPLALRICAARLARSRRLTPTMMADQLEDSTRRLESLDLDDGRHAVRAAFDLSFDRLPTEQAKVFTLLALNPGPDFSTNAAAVLADTGADEVTEVLDELAAAHLLVHNLDTDRWAMHDLLADYARHRLDDDATGTTDTDAVTAAQNRLLDYYLTSTQTAVRPMYTPPSDGPEQIAQRFQLRASATWLDAEHANLVGAVHAAYAVDRMDLSIDLGLSLGEFLRQRRHFDDGIAVSNIVRNAARQAGDRTAESRAWNNLAVMLLDLRRLDEAVDACVRARKLCEKVGDRRGEGLAWNNLGAALRESGRNGEAFDASKRALAIFQQLDEHREEARAWDSLGLALRSAKRIDEAIEAHTRAIGAFRQVGDVLGEASAQTNLGNALMQAEQPEPAIDAYIHARDLSARGEDSTGAATALSNLCVALRKTDRLDEAIEAGTRAREVFQHLGARHEEAGARANTGVALWFAGRPGEAIEALEWAATVLAETGDTHGASQITAALEEARDAAD